MPTYTIPSTNMSLPVPIIGVDPGPDYAQNVNNCFFFVDAHDHSPGKGLQVTPSGLNINSDLTFTGNSATNLKSAAFNSQISAVATLRSLYVINNDLYFRDGNNNSIAITSTGGVAGSPGSIGSLAAPASCTYNVATQTFVFAATATQAANLDAANIVLRNITSPYNGVTLSAPLAIASSYNIVLPTLPTGTNNIVVLDSSGNLSAPWKLDYSTINVNGSNQLYANITIGEHSWELNGAYPGLSFPLTNIDSVFIAPYAVTITNTMIYAGSNGTSGTTEYDLLYKATPSSAWVSVFSTTGKVTPTTALAIGALTTSGTGPFVATCNLTGHGFVAGDSVTIAGVTPSGYNGTWTVATASANSFTFTVGSALGASTVGGTIATRSLVYTDSGSVIGSQAGVTKPVLSVTSLPAGAIVRWDLLQSMNTGATDARIRMFYNKT